MRQNSPFSRKAMREAWEVLVVEFHTHLWQHFERVCFQLGCVHAVGFRCEDLHGHSDVVDLLLGEERGVGDTDSIDEVLAFCAELEACPATVAVADGADLLVCGLELFGAGLNLREPDLFPDPFISLSFLRLYAQ
jgi:hypothetical protein